MPTRLQSYLGCIIYYTLPSVNCRTYIVNVKSILEPQNKALFSPSLNKVESTLVIAEFPLNPFSCECCNLCVYFFVESLQNPALSISETQYIPAFSLLKEKSKTSIKKYPFTYNYLPGNHYPIILSHKITSSQATLASPCNVCVCVCLIQDLLDFTGGREHLGMPWLVTTVINQL